MTLKMAVKKMKPSQAILLRGTVRVQDGKLLLSFDVKSTAKNIFDWEEISIIPNGQNYLQLKWV